MKFPQVRMSIFSKQKSARHSKPAKTESNSLAHENAQRIIDLLLGPVLVNKPVYFPSDGAVERHQAIATWKWLVRDIEPGLEKEALEAIPPAAPLSARPAIAHKLSKLIFSVLEAAGKSHEFARRATIQLGGVQEFERLPLLACAFQHQKLLGKAVNFGRAINTIQDENSLKLALRSFPVEDDVAAALMMQAAIGQVTDPHRLVRVILSLSEGKSHRAITQAGFAPVIQAMIAHAQNQLSCFSGMGSVFCDIDLNCRAMKRYHRLLRALTSVTEDDKNSAWHYAVSTIIRRMSEAVEPQLGQVDAKVRQALRKPRTGPDRVDPDLQLEALNGLYLLSAVREALDMLALNTLVSNLWNDVGKALEVLNERNLEMFRQNPADTLVAQRLETGIKMASIRFNEEYATILQRAVDGATRRAAG